MEQAKTKIKTLEVGRYYDIKYRHRGREFDTFAAFRRFDFGNYYFEDDRGEWLIIKPEKIISISVGK